MTTIRHEVADYFFKRAGYPALIHQENPEGPLEGIETGPPKNETGENMNRPTLKKFKKEALEKPGVKVEYQRLEAAYKLRRKLIEIRLQAGFTQEQMATAMNTNKSNISRLENVNSSISPTIKTIENYAHAAGYIVEIDFIPN